jgi:hypothetical protein
MIGGTGLDVFILESGRQLLAHPLEPTSRPPHLTTPVIKLLNLFDGEPKFLGNVPDALIDDVQVRLRIVDQILDEPIRPFETGFTAP